MPTAMLAIIRAISPVKMQWFLLYNAYTRVAQLTRIVSQSLDGDAGKTHWRREIARPIRNTQCTDAFFGS